MGIVTGIMVVGSVAMAAHPLDKGIVTGHPINVKAEEEVRNASLASPVVGMEVQWGLSYCAAGQHVTGEQPDSREQHRGVRGRAAYRGRCGLGWFAWRGRCRCQPRESEEG